MIFKLKVEVLHECVVYLTHKHYKAVSKLKLLKETLNFFPKSIFNITKHQWLNNIIKFFKSTARLYLHYKRKFLEFISPTVTHFEIFTWTLREPTERPWPQVNPMMSSSRHVTGVMSGHGWWVIPSPPREVWVWGRTALFPSTCLDSNYPHNVFGKKLIINSTTSHQFLR